MKILTPIVHCLKYFLPYLYDKDIFYQYLFLFCAFKILHILQINNALFYNQSHPKEHNHFSYNPLALVMDLENTCMSHFQCLLLAMELLHVMVHLDLDFLQNLSSRLPYCEQHVV